MAASNNIGTLFLLTALFFSCVVWQCQAAESQDSGERDFAEARKRLSAGDFDGAVKSLQLALRHDFVNRKYVEELKSVRDIIKVREEFARLSEDSLRWNLLAQHLRVYYQRNRVRNELVDVSLQIFDRSKLTWDAVCVVNAMILAERFEEALDFAASVDAQGTNPSIQIAKGYVLYAAGEDQEARTVARSFSLADLQTQDDLFRLARLQVVTGLHASSVKTLVRCFELTPLKSLQEFKDYVVTLPEFEPLLASQEFAEALTTQSRQASIDRACTVRWIGVQFDQRPKYIRDLSRGPINPDDWKIK